MDAALTIPKPKNISIQQAATIGVGTLVGQRRIESRSDTEGWQTAALGLFNGLKLPLPDLENLADKSKDGSEQLRKDSEKDWVVVLGGASSVGKYGIQVSRHCCQKKRSSHILTRFEDCQSSRLQRRRLLLPQLSSGTILFPGDCFIR